MTDEAKLKILRSRIDAVDEKLMQLLRERADIIEEVRSVKGRQAIYIRPGREASMLRALVGAPQGHVPKGLVHRLWREMISAFTLQEGAMRAACYVPGAEPGFWDMARDHFGSFMPMQHCAAPAAALQTLADKSCSLAALPFPQGTDGDAWWQALLDAAAPHIFYAFPFDGERGNARACPRGGVVLAALKPEPTEADTTVLVVEWADAIESQGVQKALAALAPARHVCAAAGQGNCSWLELNGFSWPEGPGPWLVAHKGLYRRARVAGAFPTPMKGLSV